MENPEITAEAILETAARLNIQLNPGSFRWRDCAAGAACRLMGEWKNVQTYDEVIAVVGKDAADGLSQGFVQPWEPNRKGKKTERVNHFIEIGRQVRAAVDAQGANP